MPRHLVVGNGSLLVNLDRNLNIRDLYYPHVGLYNHVGGYRNRIGVWVDGHFSWLDDTWSVHTKYRPGTLTTDAYASNGKLGISLGLHAAVHPHFSVFLRKITVENVYPSEREIRLFLHHDFRIQESDIGDTVFYHTFSGSIVHYKRNYYILINGKTNDGGIYEYACGIKEFGGAEGTWRDAEDGSLSMHPIDQGSVDSTISFKLHLAGNSAHAIDCWLAVGRSLEEVTGLNEMVRKMSVDALVAESDTYWKSWLGKSAGLVDGLPESFSDLYERSLLTICTQCDRCGGILAANDTDIMDTARAHYSYVWPRDGALVAHALDMAGYAEFSRRFFTFSAGLLSAERPYFLQKYCPDGSVGASWHPWTVNGEAEIPHQQDSTALVLWALGEHFDRWKDVDFLLSMFQDFVKPVADGIVEDLDPCTRLPRPSYDLWEQTRGIHLFTCSAVYAALSAAAKFASAFDRDAAISYRRARESLKKSVLEHFYDIRFGRFIRSLIPTPSGWERDLTIDASMAGVFLYGMLPPEDPTVIATMKAIYDRLWVRTPVGGLARYEDDYYFQVSSDVRNVPGNPWFISTLWMADWYIAVAKSPRDLEPARELLEWVVSHASEAGLLAEQIHPFTGQPLSVMPLTWSHAAFVTSVLKYQSKVRELSVKGADKA